MGLIIGSRGSRIKQFENMHNVTAENKPSRGEGKLLLLSGRTESLRRGFAAIESRFKLQRPNNDLPATDVKQ